MVNDALMAVFGTRVPAPAELMLLTLAIVDDIGAMVVIVVAYTDELDVRLLAVAAGLVAVTVALRRRGVTSIVVYGPIAVGGGSWCFDDPALQDDARIGILIASAVAAALGSVLLTLAGRRTERG